MMKRVDSRCHFQYIAAYKSNPLLAPCDFQRRHSPMESTKSNQGDRSQQPTPSQSPKQEGFVTSEPGASMQELSDACEKVMRERGGDRRKKPLTEYEGSDRREAGSDRRKEGSDRRKEGFDRREAGSDRRENIPTETSETIDLLKSRTFKIKAGLIMLLIAVTFCFTVPIPGLGVINDDEYIVTKVVGRAYIKYQTAYSEDQAKGNDPNFHFDGEWILLTKGTAIAAGSRIMIETGPDSTVDLLTDDGMIIRIVKGSTFRLEERLKRASRIQGFVAKGKVFVNIVSAKLKRFKTGPTLKMEIVTPNAVCGVRGTVFSVDYQPDSGITKASVLEGALNVTDPETAKEQKFASWYEIRNGQTIQLTKSERVVSLRDLDAAELLMLSADAPALTTAHTVIEAMERAWRDWLWLLSLADMARKKRAEYEMGAIITVIYQRGQIAGGTLPDTLIDRKVPGEDIKDPWGNSYLYIRHRPDYAVVVSAGPDGKYNTPDDLYRFLSL
jgi:hypothetical protein